MVYLYRSMCQTTLRRTTLTRYLPEGAVKRGRTFSWGGLVNCFLQSEHVLIFRSFFVASMCSGCSLCFCNASRLRNGQTRMARQSDTIKTREEVRMVEDITTHGIEVAPRQNVGLGLRCTERRGQNLRTWLRRGSNAAELRRG